MSGTSPAGSSGPATPAVRSLEEWREIALSQAAELNRLSERVRELIREREEALWKLEAARVLAGDWAKKAGVEIDPDGVCVLADAWQGQLEHLDGERHRLDGQRWQALNVAQQLEDLAAGRRTTGLNVHEFAARVAKVLCSVATVHSPKRADRVFPTAHPHVEVSS